MRDVRPHTSSKEQMGTCPGCIDLIFNSLLPERAATYAKCKHLAAFARHQLNNQAAVHAGVGVGLCNCGQLVYHVPVPELFNLAGGVHRAVAEFENRAEASAGVSADQRMLDHVSPKFRVEVTDLDLA